MTEGQIVVRPATARDGPQVKAVLRDTFETTWKPHVTPAAAETYLSAGHGDRYVDERLPEFWVAEQGDMVVGFVHWRGDFIEAVHVRSSHARRGVGGLLLDRAEAAIAAAGFREARLETDTFNERSHAVYRARGYREKDRYPDDEWNSGFTTILFARQLG